MFSEISSAQWVLWLGLAIGVAYGVTTQLSGFCLNSAVRQQVLARDGNKLRSFLLAIVVAILGTQIAAHQGLIDLSSSIYLPNSFSWWLVPFGGLMFGYGMILARGCGSRTLVLLAQGNLRSLLVLLCLGISAFATLSGVLAPLRATVGGFSQMTLSHSTFASDLSRWGFVATLCGLLLIFVFRDKTFLKHRGDVLAGVSVGLLVIAGWLTTGWIGVDEFEPVPVASLTFVAPIGATIQYVMIASGMTLSFGIVVVLGIVLGAHLSARLTGAFRLTGFEKPTDMPRYILGGTLMGVGGALAMGCSIGQGITGMSTLSFISIIAFLGILAGAWLAVWREQSLLAATKPI